MDTRRSRRRLWMIVGLVVVVAVIVGGYLLAEYAGQVFLASVNTADCMWRSSPVVWADSNRDGELNDGEARMPGVTVAAFDLLNGDGVTPQARAVSDDEGVARLEVFMAGCPTGQFEVRVTAPEGVCPTTADRQSEPPYAFGLATCESSSG